MTRASPFLVRLSPRAAVYEIEDRVYLRLDAEGRWATFAERGALFRRSVDGSVLRAFGRRFEVLDDETATVVHAWVGRRAAELREALAEGAAAEVLEGETGEAAERLERAACWHGGRLAAQRALFDRAFPDPVPILPPHRTRDVVVLPATGCPNHRCAFCAFYRDRPFAVLGDAEFEAHLAAVSELFGRALGERDGCFLGSASALSLGDDVLVRRLRRVREHLGHLPRGIASFLEADRAPARDANAWTRLGEEGLVEATLGLETGLGPLRARLGKRGDLERFARTVRALVDAGLDVSLTVLLGIGRDGREEAAHREATVDFLAALPLDRRDRIYLSPVLDADPVLRDPEPWRMALSSRSPARIGTYRIDRFAWLS